MHRLCCSTPMGKEEETSVVEAIELIYERILHLNIDIGQIESQMRLEEKNVRRFVQESDREQARIHMLRIKRSREKRTRYIGCREKLHTMKESLGETAMYGAVQDTFRQGLQITDSLLQTVDISQIETLMDDLEDTTLRVQDVGAELGRTQDYDEDEAIEQELQALMRGVKEEEKPTTVEMPSVPTNKPFIITNERAEHKEPKEPLRQGQ